MAIGGRSFARTVLAAAAGVVLATSFAAAATPEFRIRRWTTDHGLPQVSATSLTQTRDGYLWVGTFGGLARFDGIHFAIFDLANTPGLTTNRILALHEDREGALWIGGDRGLVRKRGSSFEPVELPVPNPRVLCMSEDRRGRLLVGTEQGLWRLEGGSFQAIPLGGLGEIAYTVSGMHVDDRDRIWCATIPPAVFRVEETEAVRLDLPEETRPFTSIVQTHDDRFFFGSRDRTRIYEAHGDSIEPVPGGHGGAALGVDHLDRLWVGGDRLSVGYLGGSAFPELNDTETVRGGVRAVLVDRERNIWVGTDKQGLVQLRDSPIVRDPAGPSVTVTGIAAARDGAIVVTSSAGSFVLDSGVPPDPDAFAGPILFASDGTRFRSDSRAGPWLRPPGGPEVLHDAGIGQSWAFFEDRRRSVWIGGHRGIARYEGGALTTWPEEERLAAGATRAFAEDREGGVWIGMDHGLARHHDGEFSWYDERDGLARGAVRAIHVDESGAVWIGTYGGGLSRFSKGTFSRLTTEDGLADNVVSCILEDDSGAFWMNGNLGVSRIPRRELERRIAGEMSLLTPRVFATGEGHGGFSPSCLFDREGVAWFPTISGPVGIDPSLVAPARYVPEVVIDRVVQDGSELDVEDGRVRISEAGSRDLSISFAGISLSHPEDLRYEYRLDGYDETWIESGTRRTAFYTRLPPGEFVFRVRALTGYGTHGKGEARVGLSLVPRFHETLPFKILSGLGLLAAVFYGVRLRTRQAERRNETLRREIEERKRTEAAQRELIEAQERHRALEAQVLHAQKLESLGVLAGGIAHDFNNLLTGVLGNASLALAGDGVPAETAERLRQIELSATRAAELTREMLAYSGKGRFFVEPVNVNEVIAEMPRLLEAGIPKKVGMRLELDPDLPTVEADAAQLRQIVMNLITNAADAIGDDAGVIHARTGIVVVSADAPPETVTGSAAEGTYVFFEVTDTGCGMPDEVRARMFEPFFTTKRSGRGLGMAAVLGIVRGHQGALQVESREGRGTTLRVLLPATGGDAAAAVRSPTASPATWRGRGTILVVDDEEPVRTVTRQILEHHGFSVVTAGDGAEGVDVFEARDDLVVVVLDMTMPVMDGAAALEEMRRLDPDARVVLVSGYSEGVSPERLGPKTAFVQKPYSAAELLHGVREVLPR